MADNPSESSKPTQPAPFGCLGKPNCTGKVVYVGEDVESNLHDVALRCDQGHWYMYSVDVKKNEVQGAGGEQGGPPICTFVPPTRKAGLSPEPDLQVKPGLTNQFWLEEPATWVKDAATKRDEAAEKIRTFVGWVIPIYTGAVSLGVGLTRAFSPWVLVFMVLPILLLVFTYWLTLNVQSPNLQFLKGRGHDIDKIIETYNGMIKNKSEKLDWALVFACAAGVSVAVGLVLASVRKEQKPYDFIVEHEAISTGDFVALTGHFPSVAGVTLRVLSFGKADTVLRDTEVVFLADSSGGLQTTLPVAESAASFHVTAQWKEASGTTRSVGHDVPAKAP
jgi:hypothetical protein